MAYVMTDERVRVPSPPSLRYYNGIKEGFIENDLPLEPLRNALQHCYKEISALDRQLAKQPKTKGQER